MRRSLDIRPAADEDLVEIASHIAEANIDAAINFLHAARRSMEFLITTPEAGPEYPTANLRLNGLRKWSVDGYRQYLIFHLVPPSSIKILRVVHGARDLPPILARSF